MVVWFDLNEISNKADEYVVENALVSGLLSLLLLSCLTVG